MRINNSYISDQPKLPATPGASSVNQAAKQQTIQQAKDSYDKNAASSQVIEAEYVDLYSPASSNLQHEKQDLLRTLEAEVGSSSQPVETAQNNNSMVSKYQMVPIDTPSPGTYLNIFA